MPSTFSYAESIRLKSFTQIILLTANLLLASCASTGGSIDVQEETIKANSGDPIAQLRLGTAYDAGIGVPKDMTKAFLWYQKSAEQGNADAQNNLGSLYSSGEGIPADMKLAVAWYQKAAKQNHAVAQNSLAIRYLKGEGVTKDVSKAIYWYEEAAKNGSIWSMINLGDIYASGIETKKDFVQAYKWYDLARFYTQWSKNMELKWTARAKLDDVSTSMDTGQIETAKRLGNAWDKQFVKSK